MGQIAVMGAGTVAFAAFVVAEAGGLGALPGRVQETFAAGGPGGIRPTRSSRSRRGTARTSP